MSLISTLDIFLRGNTSQLDSALDRGGKKVGEFSSQVAGAGKGLEGIGGSAGGASSGLSLVAGGLTAVAAAAVAAGAALVAFGIARMGAIEDTSKLSKELDVSYNSLVGLHHAASQAGVDAGTLDESLRHLQRSASDAAHGNGEAASALARLGINAQQFNQLGADEKLAKLADGMSKVGNQGDKAALASAILGREAGSKLLPLLEQGSAGLAKMQAEAAKLGLTLSKDQVEAVEKANASWRKVHDAIDGIGNRIATFLAPILEKLADWVTSAFETMQSWIEQAKPYWQALSDAVGAAWDAMKSAAQPVIDFFNSVFESLGNTMKSWGITWDSVSHGFMVALWTVQFEFTHWKDFLKLGWDTLVYSCISFGNTITYWFTDVIPTVFKEFGNYVGHFFTELGNFVSKNIGAIWDAIQGKDAHFVGLDHALDGWEDMLKHIHDKITNRPIGEMEKAAKDSVKADLSGLATQWDAFIKGKEAAMHRLDKAAEAANKGASGGADISPTSKGNAAALAGSMEAYKIISGQQGDKMFTVANEQLIQLKEQNKKLEKLLNKRGEHLGKAHL